MDFEIVCIHNNINNETNYVNIFVLPSSTLSYVDVDFMYTSDSPENSHLNVQKLPNTCH